MVLKVVLLACVLINPIYVTAQKRTDAATDRESAISEELEAVIIEAKKIPEPNARVNIAARAAMLVSYSDPGRAENMLLELWQFSDGQTDKTFAKQRAKVLILKYLYSRNAKLARHLLSETQQQKSSLPGLDDDSTLPGKLASGLMDDDPTAAAGVLQQAFARAVTPDAVAALTRLRERNFLLGDYIAANAIDFLMTRPTLTSLPGLYQLGGYVSSGSESPAWAESEGSRQALQFKYFAASYEALRASLTESNETLARDQGLTPRQLQFRGFYQAELAAVVAALGARFQPNLAAELSAIASRLTPQVPPNMPRLTQLTLGKLSGSFTSEDPEQRFFFALSNGDFEIANSELERLQDSDKRNLYRQLIIKAEARAFIANSDLMDAVRAIRKLEDPTARLVMYIDAIKAAKANRDADVMKLMVNEARLMIPQTNRNGLHLRALLSFASQLARFGSVDDSIEFLRLAVTTINTLPAATDKESVVKTRLEAAMAELNDPDSLLNEPEMERAFTAVGLLDLELGLTEAKRIQPKAVQLSARLQTVQSVLKRLAFKPKRSPSPVKASTPAAATPK